MASPTRAQLWRLALCMHAALERCTGAPPLSELPIRSWQRCHRLSRLLETSRREAWRIAGKVCRDRLRRALVDLKHELEEVTAELDRSRATFTPSVRDLYDDLAALAAEFEVLAIDLRGMSLSVTTAPLVLDGVYLGPFRVCLDWTRLGDGTATYSIEAVDPRPAAVDDSVTHPHVRDDHLCEGEAWRAIRAALRSGRILDFFTVVSQTLATYNPDSAYVRLEAWEGISCGDCGCTTDEDDRTSCERCEDDLCCDCAGSCTDCGRSTCSACSDRCLACDEAHCTACLTACKHCRKYFCERRLSDEQCTDCRTADAKEASAGEVPADQPAAALAGAAIHPVCLGQAAVSA